MKFFVQPSQRLFLLIMCLLVLITGNMVFAQVPDKAAPFTGVRWDGDDPIVRVGGEWYEFVSLDDLSKSDILDFAKEEYGNRWQKRFSEDLVEVLDGMGYQPDVQVQLGLRQDGEQVIKTAEMTEENRRSAWEYNQSGGEETESVAATASAQPRSGTPAEDLSSLEGLARQYARHIDSIWDATPEDGTANLRFLMTRNGQPYAGKVDVRTEFGFRAMGARGLNISQGLNPNANGRWVYEGLEPGTYNVTITGNGDFAGWSWSRDGVQVSAGDAPLIEIELD